MKNNSTFFGRLSERMAVVFGYQGKAERIEKQIKKLDDKVNIIDDSGLSMKMKSNIYQKIIENFEILNSLVENKLLSSNNLDSKGKRYQIELLKCEAEIKLAKTSSSIVSAKMQYNYMKDQLIRKYCNYIICGNANDEEVLNVIKNINNYLNNCHGLDVNYHYVSSYEECEELYNYCIDKLGKVNRSIGFYNNKKELLEHDELTMIAFENKNAVNKKRK